MNLVFEYLIELKELTDRERQLGQWEGISWGIIVICILLFAVSYLNY